MANLALLVFTSVMIAGMFAASRGPAMRFASSSGSGGFDQRGAVRVEIGADDAILVDGAPVPRARLAETLTARLAGPDPGSIMLLVAPDASYQAMIDAYAVIAALPGPPRIAFPSRSRRRLM
jgi:biopolymer transport protein ExbD